jgi:nicotinic acid mononucleotide adenylyltransferase
VQIELCTRDDEPLAQRRAIADEAQQALLHGGRRQVLIGRAPILAAGERRAIFPGAFNPLHEGHRAMARLAAARLQTPVEFELSIHNVDKPPLDYLEIRDRAAQFAGDATLWLSRAPTFEDKSRLFADATFVVGADTIARIADPAYYGDSEPAMLAAIERIAARGGRFLVFGRKAEGRFESLATLNLPPSLLAICDEVPEQQFRADVSSSQIRQTSSADHG